MCKLELKWRSYGHLKTTAPSSAKISQLQNQLAKISQLWNQLAKSTCENFASCFTAGKPPEGTHVPLHKFKFHFCSCESSCEIISKLLIKLWNHLQVVESPPSCEITNSTCEISQVAFKLEKSTCVILDICDRRYFV